MAGRGNKPLEKKENLIIPDIMNCMCCNKPYGNSEFYNSDSEMHGAIGKVPYCRECLENFYQGYLKQFKSLNCDSPKRRAVERVCMMLDLYYSDKVFDSAVKRSETSTDTTILALYFKQVKLYQYRKKNYDTTIREKYENNTEDSFITYARAEQEEPKSGDVLAAIKIFGGGFSDDDYVFLLEQYKDWTSRHECETKAQEEIFKRICFKQLEILKATRKGEDTKDLDFTFQKLLETAKLQPKQNSGEVVSDAQTFGTLIDKWENTRPIPEIDEDLRDVDKIGLYLDTFFKGHLAKMMGLKNGLSRLYNNYMKKYTVEKPEYENDEDNEALFDAIFGGSMLDSDDVDNEVI